MKQTPKFLTLLALSPLAASLLASGAALAQSPTLSGVANQAGVSQSTVATKPASTDPGRPIITPGDEDSGAKSGSGNLSGVAPDNTTTRAKQPQGSAGLGAPNASDANASGVKVNPDGSVTIQALQPINNPTNAAAAPTSLSAAQLALQHAMMVLAAQSGASDLANSGHVDPAKSAQTLKKQQMLSALQDMINEAIAVRASAPPGYDTDPFYIRRDQRLLQQALQGLKDQGFDANGQPAPDSPDPNLPQQADAGDANTDTDSESLMSYEGFTAMPPMVAGPGQQGLASAFALNAHSDSGQSFGSITFQTIYSTKPPAPNKNGSSVIQVPSNQVAGPSKTVTAPSTQVAGPGKTVTAPSTQVAGPGKTITAPSTQVAMPSTQLVGPSSAMTAPSTQIMGPSSAMTAPSTQIMGPSTQLSLCGR